MIFLNVSNYLTFWHSVSFQKAKVFIITSAGTSNLTSGHDCIKVTVVLNLRVCCNYVLMVQVCVLIITYLNTWFICPYLLVSAPSHDSKHEDYCCLGYCSCIYPADKGSIILRNVGTLHLGYTVQHPRKKAVLKIYVWNFNWKLLGDSHFSCFDV